MEAPVPMSDALVAVLTMVKKFHDEGKYWDIQLQVNSEVFKSQRSLLAGLSEYFEAMFFPSDLKEPISTNKDTPIILHKIEDAATFGAILHFMYTGEIDVNDSNVYRLLCMSDFLRLRTAHIEKQCVQHVHNRCQKHQPMQNGIELFSFACIKMTRSILVDILITHLCQHLRHYSHEETFMEISFECLNTLVNYCKNHILSLPGTENIVMKIILNWVNHCRKERSKYRRELMQNVNFSNVSSDYILLLINMLEDFADEVTGLPKNFKYFSQFKMMKMEAQSDLNEGDSRFEATVTFVVKNFSKENMNDKPLVSAPTMVSNLPWRIRIQHQGEYLAYHLQCDGTTQTDKVWSCYAHSDLTLVSQMEGVENSARKLYHVFTRKLPGWGFKKFFKWDDLINPEKGYIKDDCIIFRAHVWADVPLKE